MTLICDPNVRSRIADHPEITEGERSQTDRLAMIGQKFAELAHESGNALQRSFSCLTLLSMELGDNPRTRELIIRQQRALDDLNRLFRQVREYSAPIRLECEDCELSSIWRLAWNDLMPVWESRGAKLREVIKCADLRCTIDPYRIGQVFRNLLENALAACPDPARIAIRCESDDSDGYPALRISVRDNGPGITPENRSKVFQAFYTTKKTGTGLGLVMCRRVIEEHGGWIAIGKDQGQGAEFLLNLPRGNP